MQQTEPTPETTKAESKDILEMDDIARKELREARFKSGSANQISTLDAKNKVEEDLKRKIERSKKFGTFVKELEDQKYKERMERFASEKDKKAEEDMMKKKMRLEKYGIMNPDLEKEKKKKRLERFGQNAYIDALRQTKRAKRF